MGVSCLAVDESKCSTTARSVRVIGSTGHSAKKTEDRHFCHCLVDSNQLWSRLRCVKAETRGERPGSRLGFVAKWTQLRYLIHVSYTVERAWLKISGARFVIAFVR